MNFHSAGYCRPVRFLATATLACPLVAGVCLLFPAAARATILITEINSNGTGGAFFEIYNSGGAGIDMTGWRWSDYDIAAGTSATGWAGASSFDGVVLAAGQVAVVGAGGNVTPPTPLWGSPAAATSFRSSWGLSAGVPILTWTGNGAGFGSGDGVVLYNAAGNVAASTIYRVAPLGNAIQQDSSTVPLSTFVKSFAPQPSANSHAGAMGGVGATPAGTATESLVWDPSSPAGSPTYRNAIVGQWGGFANPASAVTIGSPGVVNAVPEPSTVTITVAGLGAALVAVRRGLRRVE